MNHSKVLNNLRQDLFRLSKTLPNGLGNRILLAMDFESEFLKWIKGQQAKKFSEKLDNTVVYETLRFMETMMESNPDGLSKPDFVKYFVGTKYSKYLPTIMSLADIFKSEGSEILEPFVQILNHTDIFSSVDASDVGSVRKSLASINHEFKLYIERNVNKPYGDDTQGTQVKLTRDEKKRQLFFYLIGEASQQISSVLDTYGFKELANDMRSDRMFLVNMSALKEAKLTDIEYDRSYMVLEAQEVSKTIVKRIDPEDFEYNYNLLINSAMKFNMIMSDEEFQQYFYNYMLRKGKGERNVLPRVDFEARQWLHPTFIEFISFVLIILMNQVKF